MECGQTEIVDDNPNPAFIKTFCAAYSFEQPLQVTSIQLRFEVYDTAFTSSFPAKSALIGQAFVSIHELVCSPTQSLTRDLQALVVRKRSAGYIIISAETVKGGNEAFDMAWEWQETAYSGKVYVKILRGEEGEYGNVPVYQSEAAGKVPYRWRIVRLSLDSLCKGDMQRALVMELYGTTKGKEWVLLGSSKTTVEAIKRQKVGLTLPVALDGAETGHLRLHHFTSVTQNSFLDYINGGCEVSLIIGIDFTKSNGNAADPKSLHYQTGLRPNEYLEAIREVGEILQYYDSDKQIPVFGFGAKLPPACTHTCHCFALNGDLFDPEVPGIEAVEEVYRKACTSLTFHGPTMFAPLIHMAGLYAGSRPVSQADQRYYILLILTDGIINDMDQTLHEIVEASSLPISIIIVGIGPENFDLMQVLDADGQEIRSKFTGKVMARDIVQFVPFRDVRANQLQLAREVLYEIPAQLVGFMGGKGIMPQGGIGSGRGVAGGRRGRLPPLMETPRESVFDGLKSRFIEEMVRQGADRGAVEEEIDAGLWCADSAYVLELLSSHAHKAPLKSALRRSKRKGSSKVVRMSSTEGQPCRLCHKLLINTILVDCGHRVVCQACALELTNKECPVCRKTFQRWVLTHDT